MIVNGSGLCYRIFLRRFFLSLDFFSEWSSSGIVVDVFANNYFLQSFKCTHRNTLNLLSFCHHLGRRTQLIFVDYVSAEQQQQQHFCYTAEKCKIREI